MNGRLRFMTAAGLIGGAVMLAGCAAGDPRFAAETPAGFWMGLWHGAISLITLVIHVFNSSVRMYETANSGGWYDLGFLLGAVCVWGSCFGSGITCKNKARKKSDDEWDEIGDKVEKKIMRKLKSWVESDSDDDWDDIEKKVEEKLKHKIREWAEEDDI